MGHYLDTGEYILDPGEAEQSRAYAQAHANDVPNLPQSDLASMVNWAIPAQQDAQGRTTHTTYSGARVYVNDGATPMPSSTFAHSYAWDPTTGQYKSSLNQGGILGLVEGAGALAAPLVVGPTLAGALGGSAAAGGGGSVAASAMPGAYTAVPSAITSAGVSGGAGLGGASAATLGSSAIGGLSSAPAAIGSQAASFAAPTTGAGMSGLGFGWGDVFKAGTSLFGNLFGAHQQASAANNAAQISADALKYGANLQDQAAQRQEAFLRQQAENGYANSEVDRRANYDQWAARENRLGSLSAALGYGGRAVPAYVPSVDPHYLTPTPGAPPTGGMLPGGTPMNGTAANLPGQYSFAAPPPNPYALRPLSAYLS